MTMVPTPVVPPGDAATPMSTGNTMEQFYKLVFSGSYVTGGESWDPLPSFGGLASAILIVGVVGNPGYVFEYDMTNKKLKAFTAPFTEHTAAAYNAGLTGDANVFARVVAK